MPNRKEKYVDMKKFSKTRRTQKKRYYAKTAIYLPSTWITEHDEMVLDHSITDTELSKIIKHSVGAIQTRRYKLTKKMGKES